MRGQTAWARTLILGAVLFLSAVTGQSAQAAEKIRFATDWKAQAEHGGFYQALAKGYYAKRGLDVTIMMGGPGVNIPQLLATGAIDMGLGSNAFIPLNLVQAGIPAKAVMAAFQKDPQVLMTHPREDVKTLADLKGKPIMLADASINAFFVWLKAKYGFTDAQVRKYSFNMAPFLADPKAVQQGYVTSEPYLIETEGKVKPQVFLLADNGYPGYAAMILAPNKLIDSKPAAVQAFVDASIEGWRDYLTGDAAPGDALILKDNPEATPALLAQAREKMRAYGIVLSGDTEKLGLGAMTDARWQAFFEIMSTNGVYPKTLDWKAAYTTRFVNKAP